MAEKQAGILRVRYSKYKAIPEFKHRDSLLTVLMEGSPHIKVIYHIFVVIILILLSDTAIYNFVEHGKINVGLTSIVHGFGDIGRGAKIWLSELAIAVAFYPGLRMYSAVKKIFKDIPVISGIWSFVGILGIISLEAMVIFIPTWDLANDQLAVGSSVIVTFEMFRFAMKIHSAAVSCAPRCVDGDKSLPTIKHYIYFLFAPTILYRDEYPRSNKIRWSVVLFHFLEAAVIILCVVLLWERFFVPIWSDYGKELKVEAGTVVRSMFSSVLPAGLFYLCAFYGFLHAWQNAFAEMLTFGDRLFYEEWWTISQYSQFFRAWNRLVYSWLRDHIYLPLVPWVGRGISTVTVFVISSLAHEVILSISLGFCYPVLSIMFICFGMLLLPITAAGAQYFPNCLHVFMWFSYFVGTSIFWSFYSMEYFARKNCPPSESDSFFVPKSWSCPQIVFKPNWSFQNPMH